MICFATPLMFLFAFFGTPQQTAESKEFTNNRLRATARLLKYDFDGAIKLYSKCLLLKPDHIDTLLNRGLAYLESGQQRAGLDDLEQARALLQTALKKKPADARLYYSLANTYRYERNYEPAVRHLEKAVRLDPTRETYRIELEAVKIEQAGNQ